MSGTPCNPSANRGPSGRSDRLGPVRFVEETGSTNADLVAVANSATDGTVLVAGHQTAGRGRLDRRWETPPGTNLMLSALLRDVGGADRIPLVTSALAVAVVDVLADRYGDAIGRTAIKWPNDVLLVGGPAPGKVAGILAELVDGSPPTVVVGIGLNVGWPGEGDEAPPGATSLAASGVDERHDELLEPVLDSFAARLEVLASPNGPERLREAHLERSATIGRRVRVQRPSDDFEGEAVDLAMDGALVVDVAGERSEVRAGDVVHLRTGDD